MSSIFEIVHNAEIQCESVDGNLILSMNLMGGRPGWCFPPSPLSARLRGTWRWVL